MTITAVSLPSSRSGVATSTPGTSFTTWFRSSMSLPGS